jgi:hypothetical protein
LAFLRAPAFALAGLFAAGFLVAAAESEVNAPPDVSAGQLIIGSSV